jgi:hypothetical protein
MHTHDTAGERRTFRKRRRSIAIGRMLSIIILACPLIAICNLLYVLMRPTYLDGFLYVDSFAEYFQIGLLICLAVGFTTASIALAALTLLRAQAAGPASFDWRKASSQSRGDAGQDAGA